MIAFQEIQSDIESWGVRILSELLSCEGTNVRVKSEYFQEEKLRLKKSFEKARRLQVIVELIQITILNSNCYLGKTIKLAS